MLDSHNFYSCAPDDTMDVVERVPMYGAEHHARCMAKDAERMAKRPAPAVPCPICGHTDAGEKGGAK